MRSIAKFTTKLSMAGLAMCLTMGTVLANTLSEVQINPQGSGYGIVLKTDSATQIKKVVSANDRMSIILKDVNITQDLNTIYNNVESIDNVTVQPLSKKDIKITLKGKNVANSKVSFSANESAIATTAVQSIELNAPVSHYQPVYTPEMFVDEEETIQGSQTSNPELNALLTKMHITREMLVNIKSYAKKTFKKVNSMLNGDINTMTLAGIMMIAGVLLMGSRRKQPKQKALKQEKPIGLSSRANLEREIELNKGLSDNLRSNLNSRSSAQMGYGLKAYQQSQRNPYTSTQETTGISGLARRKTLATEPIKKQTLSARPITKDSAPIKSSNLPKKTKTQTAPIKNTAVRTPIKAAATQIKNTNTEPDTDSLKFLESITKIYENSGRADLAKGLKDNLKKAQLAQI